VTILAGNAVPVGARTVKVVLITVIVMMVTNCWPHHFITDIQRDGFPEIPESPLRRVAILNPSSEAAKNQIHKDCGNDLQHHELRQLKSEDLRQLNIQRSVAVSVGHSAGNVETRSIADMVEIINFVFGAHESRFSS
jgi:hypothetical protein